MEGTCADAASLADNGHPWLCRSGPDGVCMHGSVVRLMARESNSN
jgi:hypothetical protein